MTGAAIVGYRDVSGGGCACLGCAEQSARALGQPATGSVEPVSDTQARRARAFCSVCLEELAPDWATEGKEHASEHHPS
jgi:hypothetical protein